MLQQNIAPSLRQSMINEALDYHQNMNSVVFKRQARNLENYARESGKTDPSPKDVLIEGTIRQKVGEISTQIQRLNQQLNYASSGAPAPAVGSGGRRGKVSKANRAARRAATGTELVPYDPQELRKPFTRRRLEDLHNIFQRTFPPDLPNYPDEGFYEPGEEPLPSKKRVIPALTPDTLALYRQTRPDVVSVPAWQTRPSSILPMTSNLGRPQEKIQRPGYGDQEFMVKEFLGYNPKVTREYLEDKPKKEKIPRARASQNFRHQSLPGENIFTPYYYPDTPTELAYSPYKLKDLPSQQSKPQRPKQPASMFVSHGQPGDDPSDSDPETEISSISQPSSYMSSLSDRESKYPEVEEGESKSQAGDFGMYGTPSGSVGPPSTASGIRSELAEQGYYDPPGSNVRFIDEPPAPGARFSSSPNASDSSRLNIIVDNSLAAIVGGYNTLIDYIDLQQKQRAFTQQDEQLVSQLLRELIEPLKMLIANSAVARQSANKSLVDYTRIYNVISTLINRITSSPPFLKVPSGILTEKLPIREDIIQAANYNPDKQANHEYLESLVKTIRQEFDLVIRTFPKSPIEKEARELKLKELEAAYAKVIKAGYRPSEDIAMDIQTYETQKQIQPSVSQELTEKEGELSTDESIQEIINTREEEISKLRDVGQRLLDDSQLLGELNNDLEDSLNYLESLYQLYGSTQRQVNKEELGKEINEVRQTVIPLAEEVRDISEGLAELDEKMRKSVETLNFLEKYLKSEEIQPGYREILESKIQEEKEAINEVKTRSERIEKSISVFEKKFPKSEVIKQTKTYHEGKRVEDRSEANKRRMLNEVFKQKYKGDFPTFLGEGHDARDGKKTGGHVHKKSADPFGDNSELAPYLTKYLRPSKYRQPSGVPEIVSSSEESSDSENDQPVREKVGLGKKKRVKAIEDFEIIISAPKADQGFLLEKKKPKRTGGKKKATAKPVHEARPEQDLWFM